MGENVETFRASLKRCLERPDFLDQFYHSFMASSQEVRDKFRNTDFKRQNQVLADSLYMLAVAAQGGPRSPAWKEMDRLALSHDRAHLDVRPGLYDLWMHSLLEAARQHDPEFSPQVEEAWRTTLKLGIDYLKSRYEREPES